MNEHNFDLAIIGAGPGGYVAGIRAAQLGLKPVVIERDELGGVCLNWGCIPTKALLRSAEIYHQLKNLNKLGLSAEAIDFNWPKVVHRSRQIAGRASKGIAYLFKNKNVTHLKGHARLVANNRLEVSDEKGAGTDTVRADNIIIATGARPRALPGIAFDGKRIISSKEAMSLDELPGSMIIIGAGAIGVEFAYIFNSFGIKVTLIEMLPHILPVEDDDITAELTKLFKRKKIEIFTETQVDQLQVLSDGIQVSVSTPEGSRQLTAEIALLAIGVQGNVENTGLEKIGIAIEKGAIQVNENYQTNIPGVYAIGDVIGPPWLAHVASAEGIHAVEHIAGKSGPPLNYQNIPGCTYCQPQVASIGLTEKQAREQGIPLKIGRYPFLAHGKALALGENEGLVKLIFNANDDTFLGGHILGSEATELLAELSLARSFSARIEDFIQTIHAHPTLSEGILEAAAAAAGEAIHI